MSRIWEGRPAGRGLKFGIVVSRFNSNVTDKLLEGALDAFRRSRVAPEDIEVVRVPGSFEIPLAAKELARVRRVASVVCLGAIIKGGTAHWDYLSQAVTAGILQASLETGVPMTNAVLTTESLDLALERCRGRGHENKGYDAAVAAVEMADLYRLLPGAGEGD